MRNVAGMSGTRGTGDDGAGPTRRTLRAAGQGWKSIKRAVEKRFDLFDPLELVAYRSEGRTDLLRVRGRVEEEKGLRKSADGDGLFRNIGNTIRRLESDEIPGARVVARFDGVEARDETDREGFFEIELAPSNPVSPGWHEVSLEILGSMAGGAGVEAAAEVLVPDPGAEFAVISDLDDTVIRTYANRTWTKVRTIFARDAASRSMMAGAAPLYQAMAGGPGGGAENPFFYVSRSGWGLYDLFVDFLDDRGFPHGAMYLQDIALVEEKSPKLGSEHHKLDTIRGLMDDYPDLPFVLIGDSGQEDPERYRDIVRDRPDRVRAVLVRDVTPPERDREVRRIVQEVQEMGVLMAAAESSVSLARAAADFDLVPHDAIDEVRRRMVESGED